MSHTRARILVTAVVLSWMIIPGATQSPSLTVVGANPVGEIGALADADELRVVFSEPIVALGARPASTMPPWIHIAPPVPGAFYWSGTKTLMFAPDASTRLPFATRFIVRVDSAAVSVAGRTLSIADSIEHCVLRLNPQPGERILDLCTGTGWTSRLVARRGATVIGVDIARDLLDAARANAAAAQLPIDYRIGDAESLPFDDGSFDGVVSTCGIMFASRQEAAAAELTRVVRKGGRVALTTWTSDGNLFKMFGVMRRYMPAPPNPAPRSPFEWGATDRLKELLGGAFELRFEKATSFYREPSAEAAWETFSTGYGPTRALANSLDAERREGLRQDFIDFHDGFATDLGICVPRDYWLTVGVRV